MNPLVSHQVHIQITYILTLILYLTMIIKSKKNCLISSSYKIKVPYTGDICTTSVYNLYNPRFLAF